jgi:uncharacterized membrane protein
VYDIGETMRPTRTQSTTFPTIAHEHPKGQRTMVADQRHDTPLARLGRLLWREGALTALLVIALAGIGISVYLTTVHYAHVPLFCSTTSSIINCAAVTSSAYSVVLGTAIPITIPGLLWFMLSGALAVVALRAVWRAEAEPSWLRRAHFGWAVVGMAFVLYLVYVELDILHQICEWCTGIHVLTALTFIIVLVRLLEARGAQLEAARAQPRAASAMPRVPTVDGPPRAARVSSTTTPARPASSAASSTRTAQPVGADSRRTGGPSSGGGGQGQRRSGSRGRRRR